MKKIVILLIIAISLYLTKVTALTITETTNNNDEYDTIEPNTFIIGVTKFNGDEVITANKATIAGVNDAKHYIEQNNTVENYEMPTIYLYLGSDIGWFSIDQNNQGTEVTDEETLSKLSEIDIYYISNEKKQIS